MSKLRISGYDGTYSALDKMPEASGGHRIWRVLAVNNKASRKEALGIAQRWADEHPPQEQRARQPYLYIEEHMSSGDNYTLVRWLPVNGVWKREIIDARMTIGKERS